MALHTRHYAEAGYEQVVEFSDETFQCFIAIHNTKLGPSIGGCRVKQYHSSDDAKHDAMLLAKGMTYKSSLAGLNFGGGKAVVNASRATDDIMRKVGEAVNYFGGNYITAEDIGTTLADIQTVGQVSPHVVHHDGSGLTARGVYVCIDIAVRVLGEWGDQIAGVPIWVEGLGKVGMEVARRLHEANADLYVSDLRTEMVDYALDHLGAHRLKERDRRFVAVYSPCAIGQVVNADNVAARTNPIICGAANNQLVDDSLAELLRAMGVLYCPDYLVNAGGVICAACEIGQAYDPQKAEDMVDQLGIKLMEVMLMAREENITPLAAANHLAEARFLS